MHRRQGFVTFVTFTAQVLDLEIHRWTAARQVSPPWPPVAAEWRRSRRRPVDIAAPRAVVGGAAQGGAGDGEDESGGDGGGGGEG
jgi:hypothetical protein